MRTYWKTKAFSLATALLGTLMLQSALQAATDLADTPMVTTTSNQVKPNLLFVFDDSGSMDFSYLPDDWDSNTAYLSYVGLRNSQCNTAYYNPETVYVIPTTSTGTKVNNSSQTSFSAAYNDGFYSFTGASSTTTNLGTSFRAYNPINISNNNYYDNAQAAYYWKYHGSSTLSSINGHCANTLASSTDTTTREICTDGTRYTTAGACVSNGKTLRWSKIIVSSSSGPATKDVNGDGSINASDADERQNFANWFSYYRTRLLLFKSAASRAFYDLDDKFRVGFMTIAPGTFNTNTGDATGDDISTDKFLKINDFSNSQRSSWYNILYKQTTNSRTPLRTALSVAGRYYAGKNDGINQNMIPTKADDPVQYSCQQNFTLLTTDGYWNGGGTRALDGTSTIPNQDGNIAEKDAYSPSASKFLVSPRPIYDGGTGTYNYITLNKTYSSESCVSSYQAQQRTAQYQQCSNTGALRKRTSSNSGGSWTEWHFTSSCTVDNSGSSRTQCSTASAGQGQQHRSSNDGGSTWTDWQYTNLDTDGVCVTDNSGSVRKQCRLAYKCASGGSWTNAQCTNTGVTSLPLCQLGNTTAWANVGSCTAVAQNVSGVATECQNVAINGNKLKYTETATSTTYTGPGGPGGGNTQIGASGTYGTPVTDYVDGVCNYPTIATPSSQSNPATSATTLPSGCTGWPCEVLSSSGGSSNSLSDAAQYYYKTDLRYCSWDSLTDGQRAATGKTEDQFCTEENAACISPLNSSLSICRNIVYAKGTGAEDDKATWQHMTTFTMGLGLSGSLTFVDNYKTATTGSFADLRAGPTNWPVPTSGANTTLDDLWHTAVNGRGTYFSATNPDSVITGVKGALSGISAQTGAASASATSSQEPVSGNNFSYKATYRTVLWDGELAAVELDPATALPTGGTVWSAQALLDSKVGTGCDNRNIKLFRDSANPSKLVDFKWDTFGCDSAGVAQGSAVTTLNTTEQAFFNDVTGLSQYPTMSDGSGGGSAVDQRTLAAGSHLVNFLRGQGNKEGFVSTTPTINDANKLYRNREHALGDAANSKPQYVAAPDAEFTDPGYIDFKADKASRAPMLYVGSNDGMLHAFYAGVAQLNTDGTVKRNPSTGVALMDSNAGKEAWAFIPTMVLPNLYKLADENYGSNHQYYVDGAPIAGDVFDKETVTDGDCQLTTPVTPKNCWKTLLVGGLNKGGKGYYAIDITDPEAPKALWEFKNGTCYDETSASTKAATNGADCHLGYTYGTPLIAKLADGTWVVLVTSGFNNDNGRGYLYVLNAITGKIIHRIVTPTYTGSDTSNPGYANRDTTSNPSGLNQISAWADNPTKDNTATRVYGVDLKGNVWRFDINDTINPSGREATLLAQLVDPSGVPQPITTKPRLADIGGEAFVYVGTGRFLGISDKTDLQVQTVWALRDTLTTTPLSNLRSTLGKRVLTTTGSGLTAVRNIDTSLSGTCTAGSGWYMDLPDSGERVNLDMHLFLGTLFTLSNVPTTDACSKGGYTWLNFLDAENGCEVSGQSGPKVSTRLQSESMAVGANVFRVRGGGVRVNVDTGGGDTEGSDGPVKPSAAQGKRVGWREIVQ